MFKIYSGEYQAHAAIPEPRYRSAESRNSSGGGILSASYERNGGQQLSFMVENSPC